MDSVSLISMFLLGFSGTGHCIGMCGPLVVAFPGQTGRLSAHACYHVGRIITYTGVGVIAGGVGIAMANIAAAGGLDHMAMVGRTQLIFSMAAGVFLLLFGLAQLGIVGEPAWLFWMTPERIPGYRHLVHSAFRQQGPVLLFVTGMLMGFLPCGLSFAAFSRALAAGDPIRGGLLLVAFGAGTLPGLLLIGTGASALSVRYRRQFDLFSGMLMIGMAAALLADGLTALVP